MKIIISIAIMAIMATAFIADVLHSRNGDVVTDRQGKAIQIRYHTTILKGAK